MLQNEVYLHRITTQTGTKMAVTSKSRNYIPSEAKVVTSIEIPN